jgi:hypothetical protein
LISKCSRAGRKRKARSTALFEQKRRPSGHFRLLQTDSSSGFTLLNRFEPSRGASVEMDGRPAHDPLDRACGRAAIADRTHGVPGSDGSSARERRCAIWQKVRVPLTAVREGDSIPDTILRVKMEQPATKHRFSEGNSTLYLLGALPRAVRIVCHPRGSGVTSVHANLLPALHLLLLYVLRRCVFWRREARQLRTVN